jgi:hypothetical protein
MSLVRDARKVPEQQEHSAERAKQELSVVLAARRNENASPTTAPAPAQQQPTPQPAPINPPWHQQGTNFCEQNGKLLALNAAHFPSGSEVEDLVDGGEGTVVRDHGAQVEVVWDQILPPSNRKSEMEDKTSAIRPLFFQRSDAMTRATRESAPLPNGGVSYTPRQQYCVVNKERNKLTFKAPTVKKQALYKPPLILPIQLGRHSYDMERGDTGKVTHMVDFPLTLRAGKFFDDCKVRFAGDDAKLESECGVYDLNAR